MCREAGAGIRACKGRESRRIGQRGSSGSIAQSERDLLPFSDPLRRNLDKSFWRNLSVREFVNRDAIARARRFLAGRVGDRSHRGIKMLAVDRKRKADEIALTRGIVVAQPVVGKVVQLIIVEIKNVDRLARTRLLSAVSLIGLR